MKRYLLIFPMIAMLAVVLNASAAAQERLNWVAPKIGVWKMNGKDAEKMAWSGSLTLTSRHAAGSRVSFRGYFRWLSSDAETAGREYVRGQFDRTSGRLTLRGYALRNERGTLALTSYLAFVSRKGHLISRGRWFGKDVVKGNWSAVWQTSK